jgi:hypothetical protein
MSPSCAAGAPEHVDGAAREAQLACALLDEAHRLELGAGVQPEAQAVEERRVRERQHPAQALDDLRRHLAGVERQRRINSRAHRRLLEEAGDVLDAPGGEHRRQALQELLPVALLGDALVEDDGDAHVRLAADEATHALAQRDDGERHEVVVEGARVALADGVDDRVVGRRERQLVDDEPGERLARDVDAGPEALGPEEDGADVLLEEARQLRARKLALAQHAVLAPIEPLVDGVQVPVRREEPERAAVAGVDHVLEDARGLVDEVGVARIGQPLGHDEERLRREVERRLGDDLERALGHAELAAHEVEGARGGERRRHERHRRAAPNSSSRSSSLTSMGFDRSLVRPLLSTSSQ